MTGEVDPEARAVATRAITKWWGGYTNDADVEEAAFVLAALAAEGFSVVRLERVGRTGRANVDQFTASVFGLRPLYRRVKGETT